MTRLAFFALTFALCGAASSQTSAVSIQQVGALNVIDAQVIASSLELAQEGSRNGAQIQQVGTGGHVVRLQQRNGSRLELLQDGADHQFVGLAGGDAVQDQASQLLLTQTGFANTLALHQTDGGFADITQIGSGNTITAIQNSISRFP